MKQSGAAFHVSLSQDSLPREHRDGAFGCGTPSLSPFRGPELRSILPAVFAGVARHSRDSTSEDCCLAPARFKAGCSSRPSSSSVAKLPPRSTPSPPCSGASNHARRAAGPGRDQHVQRDGIGKRQHSGSAGHTFRNRSLDRFRPRPALSQPQRDLRDELHWRALR